MNDWEKFDQAYPLPNLWDEEEYYVETIEWRMT